MKRIAVLASLLLLLALCLCAPALAASDDTATPRAGVAVVCPTDADGAVPLYAEPDEASAVRMRYFSGATLTAIAPAEGGFWQVACGREGALMTGYMRESDLRFGEAAERSVPRRLRSFESAYGETVYAACDDAAEIIGSAFPGAITLCGVTDDGWGQQWDNVSHMGYAGDEARWADLPACGFVRILRADDFSTRFRVLPAEGDMSYEEAQRRAAEHVAQKAGELRFLPDGITPERAMEMPAEIALFWDEGAQEAMWEVYFLDDGFQVTMEQDGTLIEISEAHG